MQRAWPLVEQRPPRHPPLDPAGHDLDIARHQKESRLAIRHRLPHVAPGKLQNAEGDAARLGNGGHYGVTLGETGAKVLDMVLHGWGSGQRAAAS